MAQAINYSVTERTGGLRQPVRCYSMNGCSTVVLVEDNFARQAYDSGTNSNFANPQEILQLCLELPNRKLVPEILVVSSADEPSTIEAFHHISNFEPGRIVFFHPPTNTAYLREHLYHEWAHVAHQEYDVESYFFGQSCILEQGGYYRSEDSRISADENWAVHLSGPILGDSEREFLEFTKQAPVRAMVLGRALSRALASAYDEQSSLADLFTRRAAFLTQDVPPKALAVVAKCLESTDLDICEAALLLSLEYGTNDQLQALAHCQSLSLANKPIGNRHLEKLRGLSRLKDLNLSNTYVMAGGLASLGEIKTLESLDLQGTKVRNADLRHLRYLTDLRELNLSNTQIDDRVVADVQQLTSLRRLHLNGNNLRADTIDSVRAKLPECEIL